MCRQVWYIVVRITHTINVASSWFWLLYWGSGHLKLILDRFLAIWSVPTGAISSNVLVANIYEIRAPLSALETTMILSWLGFCDLNVDGIKVHIPSLVISNALDCVRRIRPLLPTIKISQFVQPMLRLLRWRIIFAFWRLVIDFANFGPMALLCFHSRSFRVGMWNRFIVLCFRSQGCAQMIGDNMVRCFAHPGYVKLRPLKTAYHWRLVWIEAFLRMVVGILFIRLRFV